MSALTPVQQQVLVLLAAGSTVSAAAQQTGVHRNTIANWRRSSSGFRDAWASVQYEQAHYWRDEMQSLGALAVETLRSVLTDEKASPSIRLRAALAVLNKISTPAPAQPEFAQDSESPMTSDQAHATLLGRETGPDESLTVPAEDEPPQPEQNCTTETAAQPCTTANHDRPPSDIPLIPPFRLSEGKIVLPRPKPEPGRNTPCPCGSGIKYKRCCLLKSHHLAQAA